MICKPADLVLEITDLVHVAWKAVDDDPLLVQQLQHVAVDQLIEAVLRHHLAGRDSFLDGEILRQRLRF